MIEPGERHVGGARAGDPEVGDARAPLFVEDHVVRLEVAVDHAAAVREAGGAQDLHDDVDRGRRDRARRPRARSTSASVRRRTPSRCSRCRSTRRGRRSPTMFGCESAAALEASRLKRSTNSWSSAKWWCRTLTRDLAPEQLVLGEVDVGHAAGAQARDHPVAAVDDRLGLDHRSSTFHHFAGDRRGERGALARDPWQRHRDRHARARTRARRR